MMKDDDVKKIIEDLDDFIVHGDLDAVQEVEKQEFGKLMEHVYEGGAYDFSKFEDSKKKLDAQIKEAERKAKYSKDKKYQEIINNSKETKKKLDEMKKKIEGLKDKAVEIEVDKATEDFEITDFKDYENKQLKTKKEELEKISKKEESYNDIANNIDGEGKFKDYLVASYLKGSVHSYNKILSEYNNENAKPDDKKDKNKIEKLKEQMEEMKKNIVKIDIKGILSKDEVENLKKELAEGKQVSTLGINTYYDKTEKNIDKEKILNEIKSNTELSKEFLEIYNKNRTTSPAINDINTIDFKNIDVNDILQIRKNIFKQTNELIAKQKIVKKEIEAKQSTVSQIDKAGILKDNNKSDAELWKNYATGDQKNAIELYRNDFGSRFKFWRQSSNVFSAFFKSFNKNKTVFAARHQQVEELKTNAKTFQKSLADKFKESLKTHINKNNVKVKEADMRDVYRNMDEQDKGAR